MSILNISVCTFGTGYGHKHTGFLLSYNAESTGLTFLVLNVPPNRYYNIIRRDRIILRSLDENFWRCLFITFFGCDFCAQIIIFYAFV